MQGGYTGHLLKRGVHFASNCFQHRQGMGAAQPAVDVVQIIPNKGSIEEILARFQSPAAIATFALTFLAFILFSAAVEYTISGVITNLAIVEDTDGGRITLVVSDEPDAPLDSKKGLLEDFDGKDIDLPAVEAIQVQPITRKLRTALQHLNSVGGFRARFRGLRFAAFYHIVLTIFTGIFQAMLSPLGPMGFWLGSVAAALCSCNLHATWTHATISEATDKSFFQRFLPRSVAQKLVLPTIRVYMAVGTLQIFTFGSTYLAVSLVQNETIPRYLSINLFLLPVVVAIAAFFLAVMPAYIALIRAEASLLPEDMSAIVPFDRTFGGVLLQEYSSRCAAFYMNFSMRGAWMSFSREVYKRVAKIHIKYFMIAATIIVAFTAIFAAELFVVAGGKENLIQLAEYIRQHEGF